MTPADPRPVARFTRGNPGAEEIAAALVVLTAALAPRPGPDPAGEPGVAARSQWPARSRLVAPPLRRGPGAWRASALPR